MRYDRSQNGSKCEECPLNGQPKVWSIGPQDAQMAILGEAPGRQEETVGEPFIGPAGRTLTAGLAKAEIVRGGCWIGNVICCRPPSNNIECYEAVEAIKCCREGFLNELSFLKALRVLLPTGNTSLEALTGERGITKLRGSVFEFGKEAVVPTFHPRYIQEQWHMWDVWVADFMKAKSIVRSGWNKPEENFIIEPTFLEAVSAIEIAIDCEFLVAVDTENTSLNPEIAQIYTIALGFTAEKAICIPIYSQGWHKYWTHDEWFKIHDLLVTLFKENPLLFQNAKYDMRVLRANDIWVSSPDITDIMLLHHSIHPELPHDLGFIVSIYGQTPYWKDIDWKEPIQNRNQKELRIYNCRDAVTLHQVLPPMLEDSLEDMRNHRVYKDITIKLVYPIIKMEERGILLSRSRLTKLAGEWEQEKDDLTKILKASASLCPAFNLESKMDMALLLYGMVQRKYIKAQQELESFEPKPQVEGKITKARRKDTKVYKRIKGTVEILKTTRQIWHFKPSQFTVPKAKGGQPCVDEAARLSLQRAAVNRLVEVQGLKKRRPVHDEEERELEKVVSWLKGFNDYAELSKLYSTYSDYAVSRDGKVRFPFKLHGTASGRLSSGDKKRLGTGNAQNIPEEARSVFVASPNHVFVGRDYSNLELRIAAYLANEPRMIEEFERNENVHSNVTKLIFEVDEDAVNWKLCRAATKIYDFGRLLYGGSLEGIFRRILLKVPEVGLTLAALKKIDMQLHEVYPALFRWQRRILKEVESTRKIANAFGRARIFRGSEDEIKREGLNHPIQSTAADIINEALIRIDEKLAVGHFILLQIHDELVGECPETEAATLNGLMKEEMERPVFINDILREFPTEGKIGHDWKELK